MLLFKTWPVTLQNLKLLLIAKYANNSHFHGNLFLHHWQQILNISSIYLINIRSFCTPERSTNVIGSAEGIILTCSAKNVLPSSFFNNWREAVLMTVYYSQFKCKEFLTWSDCKTSFSLNLQVFLRSQFLQYFYRTLKKQLRRKTSDIFR